MKYLAPHKGTAIFIVIVIVISSLLFGCTKQKLEPMTNIWVSPCYIPGWLYNEAGEYLHVVYDDAYHTKDASPVTADSTMEILEESTWLAGVSATTPSYQILIRESCVLKSRWKTPRCGWSPMRFLSGSI